MKNRIFTIVILFFSFFSVQAQNLNVHKTDGTVTTIELSVIDSITFSSGGFNYFDDFNRTEIGDNWTVRFGNWSIEDNKLKHLGDGTFNSNFIVFNTPISMNHYSVECEVMWISGGFLEDGPTVGYQIWDTPANDGLYIDDYLQSVLSSYGADKAGLFRNDRNGDTYSGSSVMNENLEFGNISTNVWYSYKIEVLLLNGNNFNVKLFINNIMYIDEDFILDGSKVALGGWKGQYGQQVYFDNFSITNLGD